MSSLSSFINLVQSRYAREFNKVHHTFVTGFRKSFGRAQKATLKSIKTCLVYLANNPVEKKYCYDVSKYRWNFISYRNGSYPFSEPVSARRSSREYLSICANVRYMIASNRPLTYQWLDSLSAILTTDELARVYDTVIASYNPIDYHFVERCFAGYDNFIEACKSYSGNEYDICEEYSTEDYKHYDELMYFSIRNGMVDSNGRIDLQRLNDDVYTFRRFFGTILRLHLASEQEIIRFFHISRK